MKRELTFLVVCVALVATVLRAVVVTTGAFAGPEVTGSGVIQAQQDVVVSAEVAGQVVALEADEGDQVEAGAVLARQDEELLLAQLAQAQAAVEAAEANLAQEKAGPRPPEVAAAQAVVDYARAQVEAARAAVDEARANLQAAQAIHRAAQAKFARLAAGPTERELEMASQQVELARAQLWAAQAQRDATKAGVDAPLVVDTFLGPVIVTNPIGPKRADVEAAEARVLEANTSVAVAQLQYDRLKGGARAEKLAAMQAQVAEAQAAVQIAQAALEQAQQTVAQAQAQVQEAKAQLALTLAGARPGSIAVAEAQVAQAKAALATLEVQRDKLTLQAPIAGLVTERMVHEGETVVAGARLFTISTLDPVVLTIYLPEGQLGRVRLGQSAEVHVAAYPSRTFRGEVVHIASQAEFTPRNIQTHEERTTTVFAVRIKIPNPEGTLKPGMPADATLL